AWRVFFCLDRRSGKRNGFQNTVKLQALPLSRWNAMIRLLKAEVTLMAGNEHDTEPKKGDFDSSECKLHVIAVRQHWAEQMLDA
ncbi:hypothetical protein, partial [Microvirga aerophila]